MPKNNSAAPEDRTPYVPVWTPVVLALGGLDEDRLRSFTQELHADLCATRTAYAVAASRGGDMARKVSELTSKLDEALESARTYHDLYDKVCKELRESEVNNKAVIETLANSKERADEAEREEKRLRALWESANARVQELQAVHKKRNRR